MNKHNHTSSEQTIVEELIAQDPALAPRRADVERIVRMMLKYRPTQTPDDAFVAALRQRLEAVPSRSWLEYPMSYLKQSLHIPVAIGAGSLVCVLIAVGFLWKSTAQPSSITQQTTPLALADIAEYADDSDPFIRVESGAFGSIASFSEQSAVVSEGAASRGVGMADTAMETMLDSRIAGGEVTKMAAPFATSVAYPISRTVYTYVGETITMPSAEDYPVYLYRPDALDDLNVLSALEQSVDTIDIGKLKDLNIKTISLEEQRERGYEVYLNLENGIHRINAAYNMWPELRCDDGCKPVDLSPNDLPTDDVLIRKATEFLQTYGIDRSLYGAAEVDHSWKTYQDELAYVPTYLSVIFPLELEHGVAHNMSGEVTGMRVTINIAKNIVEQAYDIRDGQFVGSEYELEASSERILKYAQDGGRPFYAWWNDDREVTITEYQLGTPDVIYVEQYAPVALMRSILPYPVSQSNLYMPAMRFPVLGEAKDGAYRPEYIVVPLVSEVLDTYEHDRPRILPAEPMIRPIDSSGGVAEPAIEIEP